MTIICRTRHWHHLWSECEQCSLSFLKQTPSWLSGYTVVKSSLGFKPAPVKQMGDVTPCYTHLYIHTCHPIRTTNFLCQWYELYYTMSTDCDCEGKLLQSEYLLHPHIIHHNHGMYNLSGIILHLTCTCCYEIHVYCSHGNSSNQTFPSWLLLHGTNIKTETPLSIAMWLRECEHLAVSQVLVSV